MGKTQRKKRKTQKQAKTKIPNFGQIHWPKMKAQKKVQKKKTTKKTKNIGKTWEKPRGKNGKHKNKPNQNPKFRSDRLAENEGTKKGTKETNNQKNKKHRKNMGKSKRKKRKTQKQAKTKIPNFGQIDGFKDTPKTCHEMSNQQFEKQSFPNCSTPAIVLKNYHCMRS